MVSNNITTTVQIPSRFAMPVCGHAHDTVSRDWSADLGTRLIAGDVDRDRTAAATKGHLGFVALVPGTDAWSRPLC